MTGSLSRAELYSAGCGFSAYGNGMFAFSVNDYDGPGVVGISQHGERRSEVLLSPRYGFRAAAMLGARSIFSMIHVTREPEAELAFAERLAAEARAEIRRRKRRAGAIGEPRPTGDLDQLAANGLLRLRLTDCKDPMPVEHG